MDLLLERSPAGRRVVEARTNSAKEPTANPWPTETPASSANPGEPAATASCNTMRVLEAGVYRGPHLYSNLPMIRLKLDLGDLEHWPTNRLRGFSARLLDMLP